MEKLVKYIRDKKDGDMEKDYNIKFVQFTKLFYPQTNNFTVNLFDKIYDKTKDSENL